MDRKMKKEYPYLKQTAESCRCLLQDERTGERLYLVALIGYLAISMWATTTFPMSDRMAKLSRLPFLGLVALKILLYDHYRIKPLIVMVLAGTSVLLAFVSSSNSVIPATMLMIAGTREVSFRKILQTYLILVGGIMALAFAASLLGVIENLQYVTETRGIRNSFGIVYTTDFAAHMFYLVLIFFYLKGEKLRAYHYILTLGLAGLVYYFCNARLDSGSIALVSIVFALGNGLLHAKYISQRLRRLWTRVWELAGPLILPAMAAFAILITATFQEGNALLDAFEKESGRRIGMGKQAMEEYGIKLFGQYIEMVGNGGTTERHGSEYFFLDCSYVNIFMRFGVIVMLLVLWIYGYSCWKNRHDQYFLYAIALLAFNCLIAHHLLEMAYNPFNLALFATCVRRPVEREGVGRGKSGLNGKLCGSALLGQIYDKKAGGRLWGRKECLIWQKHRTPGSRLNKL